MRVFPSNWRPAWMSATFGVLAAVCLRAVQGLMPHVAPSGIAAALRLHVPALAWLLTVAGISITAMAAGAAILLILWRRPAALRWARRTCLAAIAVGAVYAYVAWVGAGRLIAHEAALHELGVDAVETFHRRIAWMAPALPVAAVFAWLYVMAWTRASIAIYFGGLAGDATPARGDRMLENLRTYGREPAYRKSVLSSVILHLLLIVIIPWLLMRGCVRDYRVPKGEGEPAVMMAVEMVRAEREKPMEKKFVLNPQSAISFYIPDLDDSEVESKVEVDSRVTYVTDPSLTIAALMAASGRMGAGGGKTGGWPDGMDDATVRFIRLEYGGGRGWDDGMDAVSRADINLLQFMHKLTGFRVADRSESHPIGHLGRYRKGYAPPFVYMYGIHGGIRVSDRDIRALREYLLGGGLLLASCGSPHWDRQFRAFIRRVVPGLPLVRIADDDPIFQLPFVFPNGAPPLWHHGGYHTMGIKHNNRWIVVYHPGDLHDSWKTGAMGLAPELARGGKEFGINVIYYAFTHYLELTRRYRR